MSVKKIRIQVFAYATILVAFFLRVYRLADKNIWWDEGWSIWLAKQDWLALALQTARDEHPPLHYWLLKTFGAFDAFSARFISVAFGVLTIALLYRLGKRVGGARVGILAAFFLALARFHVWWSQDVKNYTPSIFFAFAAVWFALDVIASADGAKQSPSNKEIASSRKSLLAKTGWRAIFLYALCAALALWTHYLAALILIALNGYGVLVAGRKSQGSSPPAFVLRQWIFANALAAILFAPWFILYLQNAAAWTAAPAFDFGLFLKLVATVLPLGVTTEIENYAPLTIGFTILVALGCVFVIARTLSEAKRTKQFPRVLAIANRKSEIRNPQSAFLFILIVFLPPLFLYALSLTPVSFFAPKIQPRYLLILLPAYAILVALGIATLAKYSRAFALFAFWFTLFASLFVLRDYYAERHLRDEYATLTNTINAFARQGDLVLLDTDQEWPTFLYYLRAPLDWLGVPNGKTMDATTADALVQRALARTDAIWLVAIPDALATDAQKLIETRVARGLPQQNAWTFDDKRLTLYARAPRDLIQVAPANLTIQHPLPFIPFSEPNAQNELIAQLTGYDLPVRELRAGETVRVTTYWHSVKTRGEIQLVDDANRLVRAAPLELETGKDVRVVSAINAPPDARGEYRVRVQVETTPYDLARIAIEPRAELVRADAVRIANAIDYRFGDSIHLIGYDLPQKKIFDSKVALTLYWRADRAAKKNFIVSRRACAYRHVQNRNWFV
ncbi:MAG: glycosyltransferase family 39 protein [Chloroflexi bacterium]|nr:glycosyltransferase family 39 protein [Chloroflexota bacterium]